MLKASQNRAKPRRLDRCVYIQNARYHLRLVADDSGDAPIEPRESNDYVRRETAMHFQEVPAVHHAAYHVQHIVGLVRILRDDVGKLGVSPFGIVRRLSARRVFHVVRRQERQQPPDFGDARFLALDGEVRYAAARCVRASAAEFLVADVLAGDGADDVRTRNVHLSDAGRHEDKVRQRGGVRRAARRRSEYHRDLRNHARRPDVAMKNIAVPREAAHPFLNPRAAGVYQPDHRRADAHGEVHHLANLLRHRFGQRAAQHREVLRIDEDLPPVHLAVAGDNRVA